MTRSGGKVPYKKAPKKEVEEMDESDLAFIKAKRDEEKLFEQMAKLAKQKGPLLSGGIKKSGKK
ncbi:hypothetical protein DI09_122p70 [Mitosporidium daphniae]|uniref:Translation machinery associated TMA7 n=1 Tax=Mitosporidium daphniae TaxID=1485682 RepID=A0A098VVS0_9MICR|nr:uncharacterized protein DI09_122p70 [Mitosporidium daphniae]KGG52939.1 hypothetical protein DI09_122p70 [Mitosporidium daphniae]|eukprot:XP_013239375.1 uncharacterized protein DI09_122p70 [Mitosporidium daphniae]